VELSVLVVNVKGKEWLPKLLLSLASSSFRDFEVVVVDDREWGQGEKGDMRLKVVKVEVDRGLAHCRNLAAENSQGRLLLFLDNDVEVESNTLAEFVRAAGEGDIIQLSIVREDGSIDALGGLVDEMGYPVEIGRGESRLDVHRPPLYAKGAAFGMTRDLFNRVGGFDPVYFYGYDETDFCYRARRMGFGVKVLTEARVVHHEHGSFSAFRKERKYRLVFFLESRRLYFVLKNFSAPMLLRVLPRLTLHYLGSMAKDLLVRRDVTLFRGRAKALLWISISLPRVIMERLRLRRIEFPVGERELMERGLILRRSALSRVSQTS
jgi:GT2 family glycosyltransferase